MATTVLHVVNALVFAGSIWACVHWISRSQTQEYYNTHRGADPDGMIIVEFLMMGVCLAVGCAVIYSLVGALVTRAKYQAGPIMLVMSFPAAAIVGALAVAELCRNDAGLQDALTSGVYALAAADLGIGWTASTMRQRPRQRRPHGPPHVAPYAGSSPYLRPPGP